MERDLLPAHYVIPDIPGAAIGSQQPQSPHQCRADPGLSPAWCRTTQLSPDHAATLQDHELNGWLLFKAAPHPKAMERSEPDPQG